MAFHRSNTALASLTPVRAEENARNAPPSHDACLVPVSEHGERLLYRLAQSELVYLTSRLTALCQEAAAGSGSDGERLETLRQLSQRLDSAGAVLAGLGGEEKAAERAASDLPSPATKTRR